MAATATVNTKGLVGQIIGNGRYDLRELLGGGSMGHVYRAFDRSLETDVVVKIPRKHKLENPDALRRFKQESKFLVRLNHPHVVSILDVGEYDGVPFFVMSFVSGGSLRSRQKNEFGIQKPLKPASLRGWLLEIAKALDFIHLQGCVHRDVKPDNILFDAHNHAFLSDFGLSKVVRTAETDDPSQTAAGSIIGTPLFVAPELILGEPFDGRADQYSLALTVYDSLAGTNPLEGPTTSATLVNQVDLLPPPLTELNPSVSPAISQAVLKGLAKSADERFDSCVEFAEAVLAAVYDSVSAQSSASNSLAGTSIVRKIDGAEVRKSRVSSASMVRPQASAATAVAPKMQYVVTARSPIVKAKSPCPGCDKMLSPQPAFAGKKATCQTCGCRLLISADFSEIRKLELIAICNEADSSAPRGSAKNSGVTSADSPGEFDLILGQEVFGWKLSRQWALGIAAVLVIVLMLMTMFFTNRASRAEQERIQEQVRPRAIEGQ